MAELLHKHRQDSELLFTWPLVSGFLEVSQAVFTSDSLEIRPPFPPVHRIEGFANARRRVFLTATLADDSVLVTHFDVDPQSVGKPITPLSAADLGDRMILAPEDINPKIAENDIRRAVAEWAKSINVVVIVPSTRRSKDWEPFAQRIAVADNIADVVAELREGHVGLVVLINKYDGIDLPDDACRLLVIDGLPQVYGGIDRREAVVLGGTEAMSGRQLQRVEQGMGRGVRGADDYCVVLLVGARLSQLIALPANQQRLGPATRAQLGLSRKLAEGLEGQDLEGISAVITQALSRDQGWLAVARSTLAGIQYEEGSVSEVMFRARLAFNHASVDQYSAAASELSAAIEMTSDTRTQGWLQEQLAVYKHLLDPAEAQHILAGAIKRNPRVTRPLTGVSYARLPANVAQAQSAAEFLGSNYASRNELLLGFNSFLDDLVFDPDGTDEFENGVEILGLHLGFIVQRPERDSGNGPDVLWALGAMKYLVIECKSGVIQNRVRRSDVAQLSHSMNWFAGAYGNDSEAVPVLVHPSRTLAGDASAPTECRIVTRDRLEDMKAAVRAFSVALVDSNRWGSTDSVAGHLNQCGLTGGAFAERFTVAPQNPK